MNPKNLVADGNRVLSREGEENWERIFGKKKYPISEDNEPKRKR